MISYFAPEPVCSATGTFPWISRRSSSPNPRLDESVEMPGTSVVHFKTAKLSTQHVNQGEAKGPIATMRQRGRHRLLTRRLATSPFAPVGCPEWNADWEG